MKKPASKKSYSTSKSGGARNNFERAPRSERSTRPYTPKSSYGARPERPVYGERDSRPTSTGRSTGRPTTRPTYQSKEAYIPRTSSSRSSPVLDNKKMPAKGHQLKVAQDTSWGGVADWYNKHLEKGDDTYHVKVIFPNILRMLGDVTSKKVLDMGCGQGIFSERLRDQGAFVTGVDLGKELIKLAEIKSESVKTKGTHKVVYHVASSDDLFMLKEKNFDIIVCILALQNIEDLQKTISEGKRVLTENGKLFLVLNHPSFRNPKQTYWGYNEADDTQYRRVDEYMSESKVKIDMTPGSFKDKKFTVSFHRPLQVYMKALTKSGFVVTRLEEWTSHKESEKGPKQRAENKARKEIPMFMCIEAVKNNL